MMNEIIAFRAYTNLKIRLKIFIRTKHLQEYFKVLLLILGFSSGPSQEHRNDKTFSNNSGPQLKHIL